MQMLQKGCQWMNLQRHILCDALYLLLIVSGIKSFFLETAELHSAHIQTYHGDTPTQCL